MARETFITVTDNFRGKLEIQAAYVVAIYRTKSGTTCVATTGGKFYVSDAIEKVRAMCAEALA